MVFNGILSILSIPPWMEAKSFRRNGFLSYDPQWSQYGLDHFWTQFRALSRMQLILHFQFSFFKQRHLCWCWPDRAGHRQAAGLFELRSPLSSTSESEVQHAICWQWVQLIEIRLRYLTGSRFYICLLNSRISESKREKAGKNGNRKVRERAHCLKSALRLLRS